MVLTPAGLLLRTPQGVLHTPYEDVLRSHVETKSSWSLLEGVRPVRRLLIERRGEPTIRLDEDFLRLPAQVAAALIEVYRRRALR